MPDSDYVFEQGEPINVGSHGEHNFVFQSEEPVTDSGSSDFVFEAGNGLGGAGIVIEDWETGDFSNWTSDGSWSISGDAYEGNYSAFRQPDPGSRDVEIIYTGESETPSAGDTVSWWQQHDTTQRAGVLVYWCAQSGSFNNQYVAYYEFGREGEIVIQKVSGGNTVEQELESAPLVSTFGWHKCILEHEADGAITLRAEQEGGNQIASVTMTDTDYTSGELGLSSFGDTYFDLLRYG